MGIDVSHPGEFLIDRPEGSGDLLLIIFKTDALLTLKDSEITAPADSAVIFSQNHKQHYRTLCGSYVNHFMHFGVTAPEDTEGIRFNELLQPEDMGSAEELLKLISREQMSESRAKAELIHLTIRLLLLTLSEQTVRTSFRQESFHSPALSELRAELWSNAGRFGSVAQMAQEVSLSPSHFQQLYREQFGVSCYEDLLAAKIKTAQYYLGSTSLTVKEIASICGYENEISFMHRFKQRTGLTPSGYREKVQAG
ncbi:MAG: helix-turn-helix transcriptional regulator [Ruminococcus sp.]|nr:helix-turn-helix transcriptional regulator [Ruminococcus sp.]